jgi:hypothetical protein
MWSTRLSANAGCAATTPVAAKGEGDRRRSQRRPGLIELPVTQ